MPTIEIKNAAPVQVKKAAKIFCCEDCGKKLTLAQANKATRVGCSKCGSYLVEYCA